MADALLSRCPDSQRSWLSCALESGDPLAIATAYSGAARRLGPELGGIARGAILAAAMANISSDGHVTLAEDLFYRGDNAEREVLLQALHTFPGPERFLELAIESCRTNVLTVFCAIACENPYPAQRFPEANFNQMILKALFMEVSVERIAGLFDRITPELCRMCLGYASERSAAGRSVPSDIALITEAAP